MKEYLPYAITIDTQKVNLSSLFREWEREVMEYLWVHESKWVDSQEIKDYLDNLNIYPISKASITVFLNGVSQISLDGVSVLERDKRSKSFVFKVGMNKIKFRYAIGNFLKDFVHSNIINGV
ncbi:MAG: hypothetical protein ACTSRU_12695 [Candidatus Hodarchaeales archaeon]